MHVSVLCAGVQICLAANLQAFEILWTPRVLSLLWGSIIKRTMIMPPFPSCDVMHSLCVWPCMHVCVSESV